MSRPAPRGRGRRRLTGRPTRPRSVAWRPRRRPSIRTSTTATRIRWESSWRIPAEPRRRSRRPRSARWPGCCGRCSPSPAAASPWRTSTGTRTSTAVRPTSVPRVSARAAPTSSTSGGGRCAGGSTRRSRSSPRWPGKAWPSRARGATIRTCVAPRRSRPASGQRWPGARAPAGRGPAELAAHLASCARCQEHMLASAVGGSAGGTPRRRRPPRLWLGIGMAFVALLLAIAAVILAARLH